MHDLKTVQITKKKDCASGAAADTKMANTGGRSHRRLSFPPVQEQTEALDACKKNKHFKNTQPISGHWHSSHQFATSAWSGKDIVIYLSVHSTLKNWSTCSCQLCYSTTEWPQPLSHSTPVDTSNFSNNLCGYRLRLHSGIGKATFLRYFNQHAEFISSGKYKAQ